jgi:transposase
MAINDEKKAMILRYHFVEKWRISTIARQLHVHHSTVKSVLAHAGIPKATMLRKPSMIEPYLPFILQTLEKYPSLTARRLYEMVRERGYTGGSDHFRHMISLYRPKKVPEAYLRLRTLPGEQAQVDWAHFGSITIGKAKRHLMAFVMVLSYSRKVFLRFYLNQKLENFLRGHEEAFTAFNGIPRVILYDNLKSAVLERCGDAIRFHPTLLEFSAHYRYEPRPVAVARGNEKGRVERAIRYIRENFFAGRSWEDLTDLNRQADAWCIGVASDRLCPEDRSLTVREAFAQEEPKLSALPNNPYDVHERITVRVGKTPYARFDLNDYSLPYSYVRRTLVVYATLEQVTILNGSEVVAQHVRCFDKEQQIENPEHIELLVIEKRKARQHRGLNYLSKSVPITLTVMQSAAARGYSLGYVTSALLNFLDQYGAAELTSAIEEALEHDASHPNSIRLNLERNREKKSSPPPLAIQLPDDKRVRELVVTPHNLNSYDQLNNTKDSNDAE